MKKIILMRSLIDLKYGIVPNNILSPNHFIDWLEQKTIEIIGGRKLYIIYMAVFNLVFIVCLVSGVLCGLIEA